MFQLKIKVFNNTLNFSLEFKTGSLNKGEEPNEVSKMFRFNGSTVIF